MFKKLVIASVVLAASSSVAFAGHNYKGDYKGEMPCPAYQYMTGPYVGLSVGPRVNYAGDPAIYKGFEGTVSAGYGAMWYPSYYLAGEIFGASSANLDNYKNATGLSVRSSWSYGASLIPGIMITDHVLGYVRGGVVRTRFKDISTNRTGWQLGIGGQTNVYENWDLRGEYVYSQYGSVVTNLGRIRSDQFNLGVVYKII